jgi:ABC-2 type transport system permease protein
MRQWLRASMIYFGQCVQAALLYRSALAIFLISEAFATAGFIAFWYKSAQSNPQQTFYRPMGLVLYFALVTFHHGIQHHAASRELGSDIRLGKLSCSLIRPYPFLSQAMLKSMAFSTTYFVLLLPLLGGALWLAPGLWEEFTAGAASLDWGRYLAALMIGLIAGWIIRVIIGMFAFDMAQIWGPDTFFIALYFAASGSVFPVDLLPAHILGAVKWTPMYYMVGFPVLTVMGRIDPAVFWHEATRGLLVIAVTSLVMLLMWRRGIKRFEAIGI